MTLSLDATCSLRKIWHRIPPDKCIQMDIEPGVRPEVVGDLRKSPFPDNMFDVIFFDPPFIARGDSPTPWFHDLKETYYGVDVRDNYINSLFLQGGKEFKRILKHGGLLFLKWNEEDRPLYIALSMLSGWRELMRLPIKNPSQSGKKQTYWVILQIETFSRDLSKQLRLPQARPSQQRHPQQDSLLLPSS